MIAREKNNQSIIDLLLLAKGFLGNLFDGFLELSLGAGLAVGRAGIEKVDPIKRTRHQRTQETDPVLHKGALIRETHKGHDETQQTQNHPDENNNRGKGASIVLLFLHQHKFFLLVHFLL